MSKFPVFLTNSCQFSAEDDACGQWRSYGARAGGTAVADTEKIALRAVVFKLLRQMKGYQIKVIF